MFCLTMRDGDLNLIKSLGYIPVGLGNKIISKAFLRDNNQINISRKNPFYGEYTFHYWLWKNYLNSIKTEWVGFCQYRKFFVKEKISSSNVSFEKLKENVITDIDENIKEYDCVLGSKLFVTNYKFSKIIKNHFFHFMFNPFLLLDKKKKNLKLQFDLFHGKGNLEMAINLLDQNHKENFKDFMSNNISFNPHNMFICKTYILKQYYEIIFPWLEKCEKIFGFSELDNYGSKRIYGFLAERFLSYWFNKNFKVKEYPIIVKDLSDYK